MAFVYSSDKLRSSSFLQMAELLLAHGKWGINFLGIFGLHMQLLLYLLKCLNLQVFSFFPFCLSPSFRRGREQLCWAWLPSEVIPQQFVSKSLQIWHTSFITLSCSEPCCIAFSRICHIDLYKEEKYLLGEIFPLIEYARQQLHGKKKNKRQLLCFVELWQNCTVILQSVLGILNDKAKERYSELRAEWGAGREKGKITLNSTSFLVNNRGNSKDMGYALSFFWCLSGITNKQDNLTLNIT